MNQSIVAPALPWHSWQDDRGNWKTESEEKDEAEKEKEEEEKYDQGIWNLLKWHYFVMVFDMIELQLPERAWKLLDFSVQHKALACIRSIFRPSVVIQFERTLDIVFKAKQFHLNVFLQFQYIDNFKKTESSKGIPYKMRMLVNQSNVKNSRTSVQYP